MTLFTGLDYLAADGLHRDVALRLDAGAPEILPHTVQGGMDLTRDGARALVTPALIDLQVNGGAGKLLGEMTGPDDLAAMAQAHWATGTGAILPTLISDSDRVTEAVIAHVARARRMQPAILGLHLEGPHLAVAGAHDPARLRPLADADVARYCAARPALGHLMITLAPECATPAQIATLSHAGVIVALGHTACDHETAQAAFAAGARISTHLYNAMSGLHHRNPGLVGATLAGGHRFGLIADGVHVHPAALRVALAAADPAQVVLVSDAMALTGSDADHFTLAGRDVYRRNGRLCLADGTLAGADVTLAACVARLADWTAQPVAALAGMAIDTPLATLGLGAHPTPERLLVWHGGRATARIAHGRLMDLAAR